MFLKRCKFGGNSTPSYASTKDFYVINVAVQRLLYKWITKVQVGRLVIDSLELI